jgi:hypothetical protein
MMIPKTYELLDRCIADGVRYGLNRAYKHTDAPTQEQMEAEIENAVMNEICAWFEFKGVVDEQSIE